MEHPRRPFGVGVESVPGGRGSNDGAEMAERFTMGSGFGDELRDWGRFATRAAAADPLASHPAAAGGLIRGELDRTQLDLIEIEAERHVVTRTPEHVARTPKRHIFWVQLRGRGVWTPEGGLDPLVLSPGDIGYWTSEVPYRWELEGPLTMLTLRAPFHAVDVTPATLAPLIGHAFAAERGLARFAVPFAQQVLTDPALLTGQSGTRILRDIVSLFTTVLLGELDLEAAGDRSRPAFLRVVEYIAGHLAEPLELRRIAGDNDMSPRYVQSLFQERGTTLSEWIRLRRLESARQALADPTLAALSIGRIAADSGFADQAHFTRSFRAVYAETPSEWRGRALR